MRETQISCLITSNQLKKYAFFLAKVIFNHFYDNQHRPVQRRGIGEKIRFFSYLPAVIMKGLIKLLIFFLIGLLEMWLGILTFYFRSPKGSQKIFLAGSLAGLTCLYNLYHNDRDITVHLIVQGILLTNYNIYSQNRGGGEATSHTFS